MAKPKPILYKQPNRLSMARKVQFGAAGGGITTILLWIGSLFGIELPPEVAAELGAALATLVSIVASYAAHERMPPTNAEIVK